MPVCPAIAAFPNQSALSIYWLEHFAYYDVTGFIIPFTWPPVPQHIKEDFLISPSISRVMFVYALEVPLGISKFFKIYFW